MARRGRLARRDLARIDAIDQASVSAYLIVGLVVFAMLVLSFNAHHPMGALAVTVQAAAVVLISPDILRPLLRIGYLRRPLWKIRSRRRRVERQAAAIWGLWLILLVVWLLDPPGLGLETDLLEFLIVLLVVLGFLAGSFLIVVWEIEWSWKGLPKAGYSECCASSTRRARPKSGWRLPDPCFSSERFSSSWRPIDDRVDLAQRTWTGDLRHLASGPPPGGTGSGRYSCLRRRRTWRSGSWCADGASG
jgi:hypothetical protein